MMTRFVVPFEVAGLLLTAAVVGALALAQGEPEDESAPRSGSLATQRHGTTLGPGNGQPAGTAAPTTTSTTSASAPR